MSLFNFIFNTLRTRVNDKDNQRFWLPAVLEDLSGSNEQGKLLPRRLTGTSWKFQKKVSQAVKRARHIAILPYLADQMK